VFDESVDAASNGYVHADRDAVFRAGTHTKLLTHTLNKHCTQPLFVKKITSTLPPLQKKIARNSVLGKNPVKPKTSIFGVMPIIEMYLRRGKGALPTLCKLGKKSRGGG